MNAATQNNLVSVITYSYDETTIDTRTSQLIVVQVKLSEQRQVTDFTGDSTFTACISWRQKWDP